MAPPVALASPPVADITLPAAPPPPPRLAGVAAVTAPAPPRRAPPAVAAPGPVVTPGGPVGIAFRPDSASLPAEAPQALRQLAQTRGTADIWVVGYGEAASSDPATQAATLRLAFDRARAIASALSQAGVPASAIRLTGEAIGRGGVARIAE